MFQCFGNKLSLKGIEMKFSLLPRVLALIALLFVAVQVSYGYTQTQAKDMGIVAWGGVGATSLQNTNAKNKYDEAIDRYGTLYPAYQKARPGLTGMQQTVGDAACGNATTALYYMDLDRAAIYSATTDCSTYYNNGQTQYGLGNWDNAYNAYSASDVQSINCNNTNTSFYEYLDDATAAMNIIQGLIPS
jgi:hypothetical protein